MCNKALKIITFFLSICMMQCSVIWCFSAVMYETGAVCSHARSLWRIEIIKTKYLMSSRILHLQKYSIFWCKLEQRWNSSGSLIHFMYLIWFFLLHSHIWYHFSSCRHWILSWYFISNILLLSQMVWGFHPMGTAVPITSRDLREVPGRDPW